MKFQNISIHGFKLMLYSIHNKATTLNGQKLQRAIIPTFHLIVSKFNLVISSSIPISIPKYFLRYLADNVKMPKTTKGNNYLEFSWNCLKKTKKKNKSGNLHIIPNQHILFQDPSISTF